ncbi:helix-turn-helix transcriptional regulator [Oscillospiraceae bacterium HV4-5-C5C]|nr:helix-turn-helix transcriptional regulator [Oscillospiraceae bacterium HV4-5-C5C]
MTISQGVLNNPQHNQTAVVSPVFELCYSQISALQGQVGQTLVRVRPGYASLGFMGATRGEAVYTEGTAVKLLSVWVQPQAFNRFSQMITGRDELDFSCFQSKRYRQYEFQTEPREQWLTGQLLRLAASSGALRPNRLLAAAYVQELLAINLERLLLPGLQGRPACLGCSQLELDCLWTLPELLRQQLQQPPTLVQLARQLQMNDCKLKKLFKAYYGTTIYSYIRQQRMEAAFNLLQSGHCNVSQAAAAVGYSNMSHFAAAFKASYGVNPRQVMTAAEP